HTDRVEPKLDQHRMITRGIHTKRPFPDIGFAVVVFIGGWYLGEETQTYIWEFPFGMHPEGYHPMLEYLWLNPIGVLVVILCGMGLGNGKKS
ncbi:MAG: hypothetical protein AAFQ83_09345, partial [Bacteroidota bacterium]